MADLILGQDWLRPVHHLAGCPFGVGPAERSTMVGALGRQARAIPDAPFLSQAGLDPRTVTYSTAYRAVTPAAAFSKHQGSRVATASACWRTTPIDFALACSGDPRGWWSSCTFEPSGSAGPHRRAHRFRRRYAFYFTTHPAECRGSYASSTREYGRFRNSSRRPGDMMSALTAAPAPTDAALIFFTSGTTGAPKAVVQSHYAVAQNAWSSGRTSPYPAGHAAALRAPVAPRERA